MALYITLLVTFPRNGITGVRELAQRHLEHLETRSENSGAAPPVAMHGSLDAASELLRYIASGRGIGSAGRGGVFSWAGLGNYVDAGLFAECLGAFWFDLLNWESESSARWAGPDRWDNALILHQNEGRQRAHATEVAFHDPLRPERALSFESSGPLPFALDRQM